MKNVLIIKKIDKINIQYSRSKIIMSELEAFSAIKELNDKISTLRNNWKCTEKKHYNDEAFDTTRLRHMTKMLELFYQDSQIIFNSDYGLIYPYIHHNNQELDNRDFINHLCEFDKNVDIILEVIHNIYISNSIITNQCSNFFRSIHTTHCLLKGNINKEYAFDIKQIGLLCYLNKNHLTETKLDCAIGHKYYKIKHLTSRGLRDIFHTVIQYLEIILN